MKSFILALTLMTLFVSCKKHETNSMVPLNTSMAGENQTLKVSDSIPNLQLENNNAVTIRIPDKGLRYAIDDFVASWDYIPLETTDDCLIGHIDKLCTDSSFIFLFDRQNSNVFRFSDKGKFLGQFGKKGRGPKEHIELYDMSLDNIRKEICLLDLGGLKLIYYDYSGKYLRETPMYYYYSGLEFLGNDMVLSGKFAYNRRIPSIDLNSLIVSRRDQQPIYKGFPYSEELRERFHWSYAYPLIKVGSDVFFHHILSDTIWQVKENKCMARYILNFSGRNNLFSKEEIRQLSDEKYSIKTNVNRYFFGTFLMTNDWVYLNIVGKEKIIEPLIYSKSTGKMLYGLFLSDKTENSLTANLLQYSFDFVFREESFIKVLQPFEVLRVVKQMQKRKNLPSLSVKEKELIGGLQEEDNPVLCIVNLEPF